jgi:hypothetical protein
MAYWWRFGHLADPWDCTRRWKTGGAISRQMAMMLQCRAKSSTNSIANWPTRTANPHRTAYPWPLATPAAMGTPRYWLTLTEVTLRKPIVLSPFSAREDHCGCRDATAAPRMKGMK